MANKRKPVDESGNFYCPKCKIYKPRSEFDILRNSFKKYSFYGIQTYCKNCQREKRIEWHSKPRAVLIELVRKASKRGREFSLPYDWAINQFEKQNGKCFYTKIPMTFGHGKGRVWTNTSIDRIDSSLGYSESNCVLCCHGFNLMKTDLSFEAIKTMAKAILSD